MPLLRFLLGITPKEWHNLCITMARDTATVEITAEDTDIGAVREHVHRTLSEKEREYHLEHVEDFLEFNLEAEHYDDQQIVGDRTIFDIISQLLTTTYGPDEDVTMGDLEPPFIPDEQLKEDFLLLTRFMYSEDEDAEEYYEDLVERQEELREEGNSLHFVIPFPY